MKGLYLIFALMYVYMVIRNYQCYKEAKIDGSNEFVNFYFLVILTMSMASVGSFVNFFSGPIFPTASLVWWTFVDVFIFGVGLVSSSLYGVVKKNMVTRKLYEKDLENAKVVNLAEHKKGGKKQYKNGEDRELSKGVYVN